VRFGVAGGASLLADVLIQGALRMGAGVDLRLAPVISYELGLLVHFFLLTWWVFRQELTWGRLGKFHVTAAAAAAITLGVTYGLLTQPVVPYFADPNGPFGSYGPEAAKLVGTATAMGWTLVSSFFWVWRPAKS
jgi:putative flippase GtrA